MWYDVSLQVCLDEGRTLRPVQSVRNRSTRGMPLLQVVQGRALIPPAVLSASSCSAVTRPWLNSPAHDNPSSFYTSSDPSESVAILLLFFGRLPGPLLGLTIRLPRSKERQLFKCKTQLCAGHSFWQLIIKWKKGSGK